MSEMESFGISQVSRGRKNEAIGGGYFVFRRSTEDGRVHPGPLPFEHPDAISAGNEAVRLAKLNPGHVFDIVRVFASIKESEDVADESFMEVAA